MKALNRVHLPSISCLRAFESSARHLSFTRAADELHISQSAISRHIRELEEQFGVALFKRTKQQLVLTDAASRYLLAIREALDHIQSATKQLAASQPNGTLHIAAPSTLGVWLMPRIARFLADHRGIGVNVSARNVPFDLSAEGVDAAIYCCPESCWPGLTATYLIDEDVVPVCHPALAEDLTRPADLQHATLLQINSRPAAWVQWLAAAGVEGVNGLRGPQFELFSLSIQAAIARMGVALVPRFLVNEAIDSGLLAIPFNVAVKSNQKYHLVKPEAAPLTESVQAFQQWLATTMRSEVNPARSLN